MIDYEQLNLFDELVDDYPDDYIVEEKDGFTLIQDEDNTPGEYTYKVFDDVGVLTAQWTSKVSCLDMKTSEYQNSQTRRIFIRTIFDEKKAKREAEAAAKAAEEKKKKKNNTKASKYSRSYWDDDDDYSYYGGYSGYRTTSHTPSYYSSYNYTAPARKTGYVDKLNKSNTLVIHRTDSTTTMLRQVYEGKGCDVLNDDYVDKNEIHQLLESHERIVMLGHGSSYGLMGGNIGPEEAPYLKDKKVFVIWCNADAYFKTHNIGHGCFVTGNMPSDAGEARAVGCNVSEPYMNDNITYWCKLCGDVCEQALEGDAQGAVKYVRDKYWEKYGQGYDPANVPSDAPDEVKITKYNYDRTKVQE